MGLSKNIKKSIKRKLEQSEKAGRGLGKLYRRAINSKRNARYAKFYDLPMDDKLIVFECYMGRKYTDSPKAIYEYLMSHSDYKDFRFVWAFRDSVMADYKQVGYNERTEIVRWGSEEYYKTYAVAKYWFTNTRLPQAINNDKGQKYIQCWHGTPLKRLGCDITTEATESIETTRKVIHSDASRYSCLVTPSKFCSEALSSAFDLKALGKNDVIFETGYPRNDFLINHKAEDVTAIRSKLRIPAEKKVILYAPTFRENQRLANRDYEHRETIDFNRLRDKFGEDYVILFRAHYYVADAFDFDAYDGFVLNVSNYPEINELYIISDILITDYSSVFFDYSNLGRPIVFYMPDLEFYRDELRGFYLSTDELPGPIIQNQDGLEETIQNVNKWSLSDEFKAKYSNFASKFTYLDDGHATERVVKHTISI